MLSSEIHSDSQERHTCIGQHVQSRHCLTLKKLRRGITGVCMWGGIRLCSPSYVCDVPVWHCLHIWPKHAHCLLLMQVTNFCCRFVSINTSSLRLLCFLCILVDRQSVFLITIYVCLIAQEKEHISLLSCLLDICKQTSCHQQQSKFILGLTVYTQPYTC